MNWIVNKGMKKLRKQYALSTFSKFGAENLHDYTTANYVCVGYTVFMFSVHMSVHLPITF